MAADRPFAQQKLPSYFPRTGRVLQVGYERWRGLVLRFCIRPVNRAFMLLAIMDIRARPFSFSERPRLETRITRLRVRRRDRFSVSSIQLADLGSQLSATGCSKLSISRRTCYDARFVAVFVPRPSKRCAPDYWRAQLPEHCDVAVLPRL